jgi:hypothetical protein
LDFLLTNVKLFHVYIKVHNTTSDIGKKPAISNIFNRFEYISSVVWNKYLVVHLTSICTTFWTKAIMEPVYYGLLQKNEDYLKISKIASGQYNLPWAIMTNFKWLTIIAYHFGQCYCLLQKEWRLPKIEIDWLIKVLINGCFHNGPVLCPKLVIMAQGRLYEFFFWNFDLLWKFVILLKFLKFWNFWKFLKYLKF